MTSTVKFDTPIPPLLGQFVDGFYSQIRYPPLGSFMLGSLGRFRWFPFVYSVCAVFKKDFTRRNYASYLSLVTFVVTGSGNISMAYVVVRSILGALLDDDFYWNRTL